MSNTAATPLVATLRRLLRQPLASPSRQRCEICGADLPDAHAHVAEIQTRRLLCACRVCATIGDRTNRQGDGDEADANSGQITPREEGRYRTVPSRYLYLPVMSMVQARWEALALPVDLVFLFFNSERGRMVAFYPGPAGATESLLPLDAWSRLAEIHPALRSLAPDVEALLVRTTDHRQTFFIVPIDVCYELVGRIRTRWTGLGGGDGVRDDIDRFFAVIVERSGLETRPSSTIDRADAVSVSMVDRLDGAPRMSADVPAPSPEPTWEAFLNPPDQAAPEAAYLEIGATRVVRGSRVRLKPTRRADSMDMLLDGRLATVTAVYRTLEDAAYVAVALDDDPLAASGARYRRSLFFHPDEVIPLDAERAHADQSRDTDAGSARH